MTETTVTGLAGSASHNRVILEGNLDISGATELHRRLSVLAATPGTVCLDASGVSSADTTTLQLLLALRSSMQRHGADFTWLKPTDALLKTAALAGLQSALGLDQDAGL